jgi:hypothetical protein
MLSMCTFDLWMNKGPYDVFSVIINFKLKNMEPKHVTISLFEPFDIINAIMTF